MACGWTWRRLPAWAVLAAATMAPAVREVRAEEEALPGDPAAFVAAVRDGRLPPIAPWPRYAGELRVPVFGEQPPVDADNPLPAGKEAWATPTPGGTLIVQYNSAPKNINKVVSNDAVVEYVTEPVRPYLIHQDRVDFSYGRPDPADPKHRFVSVNPRDCATGWVKEDSLLRADGTVVAHGVVTDAGDAWEVRPLAVHPREPREAGRHPKAEGDVVLRGTHVTVTLRKGIVWEDGAPFRAQDVVFSVRVILNATVNSDNVKPYFEIVRSVDALDDHTVRWILSQPYFVADDTVVGGNLIVLPEHAYRAEWAKANPGAPFDPTSEAFGPFFNNCTPLNEKPLGTGPYRVEEFVASQSVTLVRNPRHFGPPGHADRIVWKFITNPVAAVQALQAGQIDFAAHGPVEDQYVTEMATPAFRQKFVRAAWFTPSMAFVAFNRRVPQLADARVRVALGLLADRPSFVRKKFHNLAVLVSGDAFVAGPAYDPAVKPLAYDPEAAGELLDEAGWYDRDGDGIRDRDGRRLEFEFLYPSASKTMQEFAAVWLEACRRQGVILRPAQMEWAAFIEKFEGKKFDAITLQWAMDPENDPHQLWHSRWAGEDTKSSNTTSFADPRADALIDAIRSCLDPKERARYHHALHRILDADQPYLFLFARPEIAAYSRDWRGVRFYPRRPGFDLTEWYLPPGARGAR